MIYFIISILIIYITLLYYLYFILLSYGSPSIVILDVVRIFDITIIETNVIMVISIIGIVNVLNIFSTLSAHFLHWEYNAILKK